MAQIVKRGYLFSLLSNNKIQICIFLLSQKAKNGREETRHSHVTPAMADSADAEGSPATLGEPDSDESRSVNSHLHICQLH